MGSASFDLPSTPFTPIGFALNQLAAPNKSRTYLLRTTFLALFALLTISVYVLFVAQPTFSPEPLSTDAFRLAALRHKTHPDPHSTQPQISLDPAQELAAVSSFIISLPQNVIPSFVDPSRPIDPQLVLDFDTRGPNAADEVKAVVDDVWTRNPVVLYSKFYSPVSREIKQMLDDLYLRPAPVIIEVDQRADEAVLAPLLYRLTSTSSLPILLIGGKPAPPLQELRYLKDKGELKRMIEKAGGEPDGARRKKGKKL